MTTWTNYTPTNENACFPDQGPVVISDQSDQIWTSEVLQGANAQLIAIVPRSCEPVNVEKSMGRAEQVVRLATFE